MPRHPTWSDDELIDAVARSTSLYELCRLLDLHPGGGTYRTLERHIARLGIDSTHLARRRVRPRRLRWSDEELVAAVRDSISVSEVLRRLSYEVNGGNFRHIKRHITRLGLDTSHFRGQGWARGKTFRGRHWPLSKILVRNSPYLSSSALRKRLIAAGLKVPHCEACGRTEWNGHHLPLELDHVNGDPSDNRLENLRILCPNCHAVTETWCNKAGRRSPTGRRRGP